MFAKFKDTENYITQAGGDCRDPSADIRLGSESKFIPKLNASRWNNEAWLDLNYEGMIIKSEKPRVSNGLIKIAKDGVEFSAWQLNKNVVETSLRFNTVYDLPPDDKIRFRLSDSGNLTYYYQPRLTQDDIETYNAYRPERVVGSYATYFNKKWNEYGTGKFGHMYRWEVIDSRGVHRWCKPLLIENGLLTIELPDLTGLFFPILAMGAGDTFGYDTVGASNRTTAGNYHYISAQDSPASAGTITSIDYHSPYNDSDAKTFGVYKEASPGEPTGGDLVDYTVSDTTQVDNDWLQLAAQVGYSCLASEVYWISLLASAGVPYSYDSGGSGVQRSVARTYGDGLNDPWPADSNSSYLMSLRVTYTPGGGGISIPVAMNHLKNQGIS